MIKKYPHLIHPAILYALLCVVVVLFSWMGSIYELTQSQPAAFDTEEYVLQNLLSPEAIRWFVRNVTSNFLLSPIGNVMLVLIGLGILEKSGMVSVLWKLLHRHKPSLKQQRALMAALLVFVLCVAVVVTGLIRPWGMLLGVTGTILHSPFADGLLFFISLTCCMVSMVYGSICGEFRSSNDIVMALSHSISDFASYLLTLFIASQLIACIKYSCINLLLGISDTSFYWISQAIYWLPLIYLFFVKKRTTSITSTRG